MKLTNFSIRHHVAILVMCLGLLILGWQSYQAMPRESFPDVRIPVVIVSAVLDGANPTDIETAVTIPLETAIDGTEGMKEMKSTSMEGLSLIMINFYPEVSSEVALQRIRDAVDIAKQDLPPELKEPVVKEFSLSSIPIVIYDLIGSDNVSRSELQELAEKMRDAIKLIPGVLDVNIFGGRQKEVVIEVDPERVHFYNLSLAGVVGIVRGSNRNVSAGATEQGTHRIVMRVPGEFTAPADILQLVVGTAADGTPIYFYDVATARFDYEDEKTRARSYNFLAEDGLSSSGQYVQPEKSVSLQITKRAGENILRIAEDAEATTQSFPLPPSVKIVKSLDQSKTVNMMVRDLENGILTALILVLLVIFFGLGVRNAFLVSLAIPFSMLMAIGILRLMGETLNMMVLFALILSLGMLVDNAIVIVENIYRHYSMGLGRLDAAMAGTAEVAWPVITSTATTVGAFFPLLFWPDVVGEFMSYLPKTVIIVLLSSLFVALVINPTLAAMIMKRRKGEKFVDPETQRPDYWAVLKYEKFLGFLLRRPYWTLITAGVMLVLTLRAYAAFGSGTEFFPAMDPNSISCSVTPPEGSSLEEASRLSMAAEDRLFGAPGSGFDKPLENIKYATAVISLDQGGSVFFAGPGAIHFDLEMVDREYRTESTAVTLTKARQRLAGQNDDGEQITYPLYQAEYEIEGAKEGPPTGKPVSIDIYGENLNEMARIARDMKELMANTNGTAKASDDASAAAPTLRWEIDLARAGMVGLDRATISNFISMAIGGYLSGTLGHGDDEQDIRLRLPEEFRAETDRLLNVYIPTPTGGSVPLVSLASAKLEPGPVTIRRFNRKRVVTVSADVQPNVRADSTVREQFQEKARQYPFPPGITYRFGGAAEDEEASRAFLGQAFLIAIFLIIMVLVLQFNSLGITAIILCSVVLAQMGVFIGLLVLRMPFGVIMTGIATISLAGVVVNNAIVMLDAIQKFQDRGFEVCQAITTAAMIRFRPVLLTAVTTMLGLLPMALKLNIDFGAMVMQFDAESSQWWQSMAVAIIFGLLISTILTLGVVPALYLLYCRAMAVIRRRLQERTSAA